MQKGSNHRGVKIKKLSGKSSFLFLNGVKKKFKMYFTVLLFT